MTNNYSRGKIYKICCNKTGNIYIGSTTETTLARRLVGHRCNFKKWKDKKIKYITSFQILEGNDYYIELLEVYPCNIKEELLARERYYIQSIECVNKYKNLNMTKEDLKETMKEYNEKNKEKIKEQKKEYYEKNKDKIEKYKKNWGEKIVYCPNCNKEMRRDSISKHLKNSCPNKN